MKTKQIFAGVVNNIVGNQIYFKAKSAASYRAETGSSQLVRKNGAAMKFEEIVVGDRVQVQGKVWPDNSINAVHVRNMSLYAHNSSFSGKVTGIDPVAGRFIIESRAHGKQTITTNPYTEYRKNKQPATIQDITLGMNVKVKGMWERVSTIVDAKSIHGTERMLNITITGEMKMVALGAITVLADNVIYGADIVNAKLLGKNGKPAQFTLFQPGQQVRVKGKHAAENVQIYASEVKNFSV